MTRYLLDSDAVVDYLKGVASTMTLVRHLGVQRHELCTCDVVVCEIHSGLGGLLPQQRAQGERLLAALEDLPTSRRAAQQAGEWRAQYRSQGMQLPATDCLIAAVAHEHGAQFITANLRDFPMSEVIVLPLPGMEAGTTR